VSCENVPSSRQIFLRHLLVENQPVLLGVVPVSAIDAVNAERQSGGQLGAAMMSKPIVLLKPNLLNPRLPHRGLT
jgi:hypothetical protein